MYTNKTISRSVGYMENRKRNNLAKAQANALKAHIIKHIGQIIKVNFTK